MIFSKGSYNYIVSGLILFLISLPVHSAGFSLSLEGGILSGPGNMGTHKLQNGTISNFIVSAPLTGNVAFFNNATELPNIYAETLHVTAVDGALSDGTKINENVDVGFVLEFLEPETGQPVKLLVCSVSEETVRPDGKGGLLFTLTAGFDPGLAELVVKREVTFVTGVATVPISEKTRLKQSGGTDAAGEYASGYAKVGKLGDFDNDGMLDGEFILADIAPLELVIAEGDPILVVRGFTSDIPVSAVDATIYALKGMHENYPRVIDNVLKNRHYSRMEEYLSDIYSRMEILRTTISTIRISKRKLSISNEERRKISQKKHLIDSLEQAINQFELTRNIFIKEEYSSFSENMNIFFSNLNSMTKLVESIKISKVDARQS